MPVHFYLVSTPLQLINAIEAKKYFAEGAGNIKHFLMIANLRFSTLKQLTNLLPLDHWDCIEFLNKKQHRELTPTEFKLDSFFYSFKELFIIRHAKKFIQQNLHDESRLYLGNYATRISYAVAQWYRGEIILIDDGTLALKTFRFRENEMKLRIAHFFHLNPGIRKRTELWITGIKKKPVPGNVTFFSAFLNNVNDKRVVQNNYLFLKNMVKNKTKKDEVFFIGSPHVEFGIISKNYFFYTIKKIALHYQRQGLDFIYIAHRNESGTKLQELKKTMKVDRPDLPIELKIILSDQFPRIIASFYSAALITISCIFPNKIEIHSYRLDEMEIIKGNKENISEIYRMIANITQSEIKVMNIPGIGDENNLAIMGLR